jgi:hypothetical protein
MKHKQTKPSRYQRGHIEKKPKSPLIGRDIPGTIVDTQGKQYSFTNEDFDSKQLPNVPQEGAPVIFVVDPDEPGSVMYVRDVYC